MDSKEKAMKIKMLQNILEKEYGITSPAELMEAMRNMPKLDISIFVTTPSGAPPSGTQWGTSGRSSDCTARGRCSSLPG